MRTTKRLLGLMFLLGTTACIHDARVGMDHDDGGGTSEDSMGDTGETDEGDDGDETPSFDVGDPDPPQASCMVFDDGNAPGSCEETAPPDSFDPEVQWAWQGEGAAQVIVTPLVANLSDDNDDGVIDLCDTPDVLVVAQEDGIGTRIVILSGDDGTELRSIESPIDDPLSGTATPAIGDIDDDGIPEIVAMTGSLFADSHVVVFEHDGTVKWTSPQDVGVGAFGAIALADLDADGTVEIIAGDVVLDADGNEIFDTGGVGLPPSVGALPTAVDLDGDDDLEVVYGSHAYHHDGSLYFDSGLQFGVPSVADLDADGKPEVLLMNPQGINVLEHDGTVKFEGQRPTGDPAEPAVTWFKPATIHDLDGDGAPEMATSSGNNYAAYEITDEATIIWQASVLDLSGSAAGTAFDFDGDATAEAMYADETRLFVYDGEGQSLLSVPRTSGTAFEYPVVSDVDNDGSAEIVVVSNDAQDPDEPSPAVQVIRDVEDRWIQARRIWNQHSYHVTNVREDGTIPTVEPKHWEQLNTFRTNAQIEEGTGVCIPQEG